MRAKRSGKRDKQLSIFHVVSSAKGQTGQQTVKCDWLKELRFVLPIQIKCCS